MSQKGTEPTATIIDQRKEMKHLYTDTYLNDFDATMTLTPLVDLNWIWAKRDVVIGLGDIAKIFYRDIGQVISR